MRAAARGRGLNHKGRGAGGGPRLAVSLQQSADKMSAPHHYPQRGPGDNSGEYGAGRVFEQSRVILYTLKIEHQAFDFQGGYMTLRAAAMGTSPATRR